MQWRRDVTSVLGKLILIRIRLRVLELVRVAVEGFPPLLLIESKVADAEVSELDPADNTITVHIHLLEHLYCRCLDLLRQQPVSISLGFVKQEFL